jgi:hypothetical protein
MMRAGLRPPRLALQVSSCFRRAGPLPVPFLGRTPRQGSTGLDRRVKTSKERNTGVEGGDSSRPATSPTPTKTSGTPEQSAGATGSADAGSPVTSPPLATATLSGNSLSSTLLKPFHLVTFMVVLLAGMVFLATLLYVTADIQWQKAGVKVLRRLFKTVALRQVMGIVSAMAFVRFGLEPLVKVLRVVFSAQGSWEKSSEFYILREVGEWQLSVGQNRPEGKYNSTCDGYCRKAETFLSSLGSFGLPVDPHTS